MTRHDEYDIDEKRMPVAWMTSRRDEYDVVEKRMPAAWITSRRDEYDIVTPEEITGRYVSLERYVPGKDRRW